MIAVHKEAENFRLENQKARRLADSFHPGAVKYFAERGVKFVRALAGFRVRFGGPETRHLATRSGVC